MTEKNYHMTGIQGLKLELLFRRSYPKNLDKRGLAKDCTPVYFSNSRSLCIYEGNDLRIIGEERDIGNTYNSIKKALDIFELI